MASRKVTAWLGYLGTFLLGIVIMVIVYALFEPAASRTRSGSTDTVDDATAEVLSNASRTSIVLTAGQEEASPSPSAFLGVEIVSVDSVIAEQLDIRDGHGVLVNGVVPNSPAEAAGLARNDVIAAINSTATIDVETFRRVMMTLDPGDRVRITYVRDGRKQRVYVELAQSPVLSEPAQATAPSDSGWGISLSPIDSTLRESLDIPANISGVVILSVVPGAAADEAGLEPGDVIVGIDRVPISDMSDFFGALSSDTDNTALWDVFTQGGMRYVPMDSSGIEVAEAEQTEQTLSQRFFSIFTGGAPFASDDDDEEEEEGPKGGKFAQDDVQLTADTTTGFARPSAVPGDTNTGGSSSGDTTGMTRPSTVPGQTNTGGSSTVPNDTVLFIGLLLIALLFLAYREYHRPPEVDKTR